MANYIMQNSGQDLDNAVTAYKNGTISKSKVGLGNVDNTSDLNKPISVETQAALNAKADSQNDNGGFSAGNNASSESTGAAIGQDALCQASGGAVGEFTTADSGGSVGNGATSRDGGAVGQNAITSDGFAGGKEARAQNANADPIDAIQLGTGTNNTPKTFQVYDYQLMDANGNIPVARLANASGTTVEDVLTSTSTTNALSANQGRILKNLLDGIDGIKDIGEISGGFVIIHGAATSLLLDILDSGIYKFTYTPSSTRLTCFMIVSRGESSSYQFVIRDDSIYYRSVPHDSTQIPETGVDWTELATSEPAIDTIKTVFGNDIETGVYSNYIIYPNGTNPTLPNMVVNKEYVDNKISTELSATDTFSFKGDVSIGVELPNGETKPIIGPNIFPDDIGTCKKGWIYRAVDRNGTIAFGSDVISVSIGDLIIAVTDMNTSTELKNISNWRIINLHANTGVPAGTVIYYAAATPPAGYLKCDGSAVSRTAYSALFAVIGTTYGAGDGSTTFQLPDLRAEFLRGYDDGRGIDTDRVFGSSQEGTQLYLGSFNATWYGTDGEENADNASSSKISGTSSSTGSSSSIRVRPRNVTMLACIKY